MGPDPAVVGDLGESGLLARIAARMTRDDPGWIGDDAAVLPTEKESLLFAIDGLQEGVDFDLAYADAADVGWRSVAVNLSDIAAMGGEPLHLVTALNLSRTTPVAWVDAFLEGTVAAGREWNAAPVGGDLGRSAEIGVTVAVLGRAAAPVLRSGARPGDLLCVTGSLGGSAAGLRLLRAEGAAASDSALARRHLRPRARVAEGAALADAGATAMIDVSDGLALDLYRLMSASGTGCRVDPGAIPVDPGIRDHADALQLALHGGEDYELLAAIPQAGFEAARAAVDGALTVIGRVTEDGRTIGDEPLDEEGALGWDHLRSP